MPSESEIKDLMLAVIGAQIPGGYPANSTEKVIAWINAIYPQAVNEGFAIPVNWKFATTRAQLAKFATDPAFGEYSYQHTLPNNCVRIIQTVDERGDRIVYPYRREVHIATKSGGRQIATPVILTNEKIVRVKYVVKIDDTNQWPARFVEVVYLKGAFLLSQPLKMDKDMQYNLVQLLERAEMGAKNANNIEDLDTDANDNPVDVGIESVAYAASLHVDDQRPRRIVER